MWDKRNINWFNLLFKGGEAAMQSVVAHNIHKNIGRVQEGGTAYFSLDPSQSSLTMDSQGRMSRV